MALKYVGTIVNTKGYKGKVFVDEVPRGTPIFDEGTMAYVGYSESFTKEYTIKEWKKHKSGAMARFKEIDSDQDAVSLKEQGVFIDEKDFIKKEKSIENPDDLIGCQVIDNDTGKELGKIMEVWEMPANNVWLMQAPEGKLPIPVTDEVIQSVDLEEKMIKIKIIPGLMDILENEDD